MKISRLLLFYKELMNMANTEALLNKLYQQMSAEQEQYRD